MDAMCKWVVPCGAAVLASIAALGAARAAPAPVAIAACGDSAFEVTAGAGGGTASLRGVVVTGGERWTFTAGVGLVRLGGKTRTITVEDVKITERKPPREAAAPSALFIDLLVADGKVILRHASEGGDDPAIAIDLDRCSFPRDGEPALAALVPPPTEPLGCAADAVRGGYLTQVNQAAKLAAADAEREARALCEDHQKTIEARARLEAAISDRAARDRIAARGPAILRTEEARIKAWNRVDGCLAATPAKGSGVAALHDGEARTRACYAKIAVKP